jgi:hypothetical protein
MGFLSITGAATLTAMSPKKRDGGKRWAPAMPWWPQSHDRVIKNFLDEPVPKRPVDIETRACTAVGDEFYARLSSEQAFRLPL